MQKLMQERLRKLGAGTIALAIASTLYVAMPTSAYAGANVECSIDYVATRTKIKKIKVHGRTLGKVRVPQTKEGRSFGVGSNASSCFEDARYNATHAGGWKIKSEWRRKILS